MWLYALVFLAILIVEIFVLVIHFPVETNEFKVFFLLLMVITGLALAVFAVEGFLQNRRKISSSNRIISYIHKLGCFCGFSEKTEK